MQQEIYQHSFPNGLTLLVERMEHVRSAAMYFMVPAGCAHDPVEHPGLAGILSDMITRGAGNRDNRQLTDALDNLGLDRSESVGVMHMHFWGTTLARNLPPALEIYADILRRPHLPADELESCQALAIQDINGLEDEPGSKVMVELRKHLYPAPLSNDHRGTVEGIDSLSPEILRRHYEKFFHPSGAILSIAGNVEFSQVRDQVAKLFGDWAGDNDAPLQLGPPPGKRAHIEKELEQTQITVAYPSVPFGHEDFYAARGAVQVLDGGMGARLFTEIREKEGLCYSVGATHQAMKDRGAIIASAASLNDQAQRTLDKLIFELKRLPEGIEEEEVARVRIGLKTSLIMQQESTSSRALSMASDWYYLNRIRSFGEIQSAIDSLNPKRILDHLHRFPPRDFSIVTLGPKSLTVAE